MGPQLYTQVLESGDWKCLSVGTCESKKLPLLLSLLQVQIGPEPKREEEGELCWDLDGKDFIRILRVKYRPLRQEHLFMVEAIGAGEETVQEYMKQLFVLLGLTALPFRFVRIQKYPTFFFILRDGLDLNHPEKVGLCWN